MNYYGGGWFGSYFPLDDVDDGVAPTVDLLFPMSLSVAADNDPSVTFTFPMTLTATGVRTGVTGTRIRHRASGINPGTITLRTP